METPISSTGTERAESHQGTCSCGVRERHRGKFRRGKKKVENVCGTEDKPFEESPLPPKGKDKKGKNLLAGNPDGRGGRRARITAIGGKENRGR